MKLIDNKDINDATLNLALEEWCVRNLSMAEDDYLLFYINSPAIIIGKHQNTIEEINQDYIEENDIKVVRRISGGGTVYHDTGNLNFSFMTKAEQDKIHNFHLFTEPVIKTLKSLGVDAELGGRNDITVGEKKISGNAQFTDTKAMFSHGTLLFDSQLDDVVKALNVKIDKIQSKGIKSVRARVANIKEYLKEDIDIYEFKKRLIENIFDGDDLIPTVHLNNEQWKEVEELANNKYRNWDWNYGRSPEFNIQKERRFDFGKIDARIDVKDGFIKDIKFYGDFLTYANMQEIEDKLINIRYDRYEIARCIQGLDLTYYFGNISKEDFTKFLYLD